jgi:hypothetical protein
MNENMTSPGRRGAAPARCRPGPPELALSRSGPCGWARKTVAQGMTRVLPGIARPDVR